MLPITEKLLLLATALSTLAWVFNLGRLSWQKWTLILGPAALLLVCFLISGYRPVLLPLGVVVLLLVVLHYFGGAGIIPRRWLRYSASIVVVAVTLAAIAIPIVFYIPVFPEPTGSHAVGHRLVHWVDDSREEVYTENPDDLRELPIHIWYPARVQEGTPKATYMSRETAEGVVQQLFPSMPYLAANLARATSHHYDDVPLELSSERYPVLVFSHGFSWNIDLHQVLMEAAASHGYVVFAIDHTYDAATTTLSDGTRAQYGDAVRPPEPSEQEQAALVEFLQEVQFPDENLSDYEKETLWVELFAMHPLVQQGVFDRWEVDKRFVVDQLFAISVGEVAIEDNALAEIIDAIDLERLGVYGMSGGGAAAGMFCFRDLRCKAGVNLDGTQFGGVSPDGEFSQPFMFMMADQDMADNPSDNRTQIFKRQPGPAYYVEIAGTTHGSFGDFPFLSMLFERSVSAGKAERLDRLINDFTLAIFDRYLQGKSVALLSSEGAKLHPEITFDARYPQL